MSVYILEYVCTAKSSSDVNSLSLIDLVELCCQTSAPVLASAVSESAL